jgi:hypothetical protein
MYKEKKRITIYYIIASEHWKSHITNSIGRKIFNYKEAYTFWCQQQYIMYIHIFDCNEEGTIDDMIFICDLHRVTYYHTYKTVVH